MTYGIREMRKKADLLLQLMDSCAGLLGSLLVKVTVADTLPFDVRRSKDSVQVKSPSIVELDVVTSADSATSDLDLVRAHRSGAKMRDIYLHVDGTISGLQAEGSKVDEIHRVLQGDRE